MPAWVSRSRSSAASVVPMLTGLSSPITTASGGQELVERVFRDRSRRARHDVRGEAPLRWRRPRGRRVSVAGSSAMCEPWPMRDTPSSFGVDAALAGPASAAWAVSPSPPLSRSQRTRGTARATGTAARHPPRRTRPRHDPRPRRRSACHGHVRRLILCRSAQTTSPTGSLLARLRGQSRARCVDDGRDVEPGPGVGGRPEADLEVVAAVRGRVLDCLTATRRMASGAPSTGYAAAT